MPRPIKAVDQRSPTAREKSSRTGCAEARSRRPDEATSRQRTRRCQARPVQERTGQAPRFTFPIESPSLPIRDDPRTVERMSSQLTALHGTTSQCCHNRYSSVDHCRQWFIGGALIRAQPNQLAGRDPPHTGELPVRAGQCPTWSGAAAGVRVICAGSASAEAPWRQQVPTAAHVRPHRWQASRTQLRPASPRGGKRSATHVVHTEHWCIHVRQVAYPSGSRADSTLEARFDHNSRPLNQWKSSPTTTDDYSCANRNTAKTDTPNAIAEYWRQFNAIGYIYPGATTTRPTTPTTRPVNFARRHQERRICPVRTRGNLTAPFGNHHLRPRTRRCRGFSANRHRDPVTDFRIGSRGRPEKHRYCEYPVPIAAVPTSAMAADRSGARRCARAFSGSPAPSPCRSRR
jgi:hypothetical protein